MNQDHLEYAQSALSTFIHSAVQRIEHSGNFLYNFSLSESDVKSKLNVTRVKTSLMHEYEEFFESKGVQATYNPKFGSLDLAVDLNRVTLNPRQATELANAIRHYRTVYGE